MLKRASQPERLIYFGLGLKNIPFRGEMARFWEFGNAYFKLAGAQICLNILVKIFFSFQ